MLGADRLVFTPGIMMNFSTRWPASGSSLDWNQMVEIKVDTE